MLVGGFAIGAAGAGIFFIAWLASMKPDSLPTPLEEKTMVTGVALVGIGFAMLMLGFFVGIFGL